MAIAFETPIGEDDVRLMDDRQSVALTTEKFGALVEYVEQLEGTLKFADFEFEQEKALADCVLRALLYSLRVMRELGHAGYANAAAQSCASDLQSLYERGLVGLEGARAVVVELAKLSEQEAAAESADA